MNKIEDIEAWQKARKLTFDIYEISKKGIFVVDFELRNQIRRAAISVMSNIAEGFERGGDREFIQYLSCAKGSCGEVRSQLYIAFDQQYIDRQKFNEIYLQTMEVGRLISGFMRYLKSSEMRGNKFK